MNGNGNLAYINAFRADHHDLHKLAESVRVAADEQRSWSEEAALELEKALSTLAEHLRCYFGHEEEGGYLEQSMAFAPRFSLKAGELLVEHGVLLQQIDELVEFSRCVCDAEAWNKLKSDVRSLITALLRHETVENRIVQQAFNSGEEI